MISKKQKGRGTGIQLDNPFSKQSLCREHPEGIDDWDSSVVKTEYLKESPKSILSRNESPDIPFEWSINPYQGCEHGCVYCYARNSHNYWGFNAGLDFESKIIVKSDAPELLSKIFRSKTWKPAVVMLSGNTDCYQPAERKLKITRSLLRVFLDHRNPVGIITKNALIGRDIDLLSQLAELNLVKVIISITSLDENLRRLMEPRTSTVANKWKVIAELKEAGVPSGILIGPVIPGLNDHEIPEILKRAGELEVDSASYTLIRLNGQLNKLFEDWLERNFPDRKDKIISQIKSIHGGQLNDSRFVKRMSGEGNWSETISKLFRLSVNKYLKNQRKYDASLHHFRRNRQPGLFDTL